MRIAHAQDNLNFNILNMFDGTLLFDAVQALRRLDRLSCFSTISDRETTFVTSCLIYCIPVPFQKGCFF